LEEDFNVVGISRSQGSLEHPKFTHLPCDLSCENAIEFIRPKLLEINDLKLLINAAGFGRFEPHEEISHKTISQMISLNLGAPVLLSNILLRALKHNQGTIINITSIEATRHSKFSAVYTATKAGLRAFGHSLFEEVRSSGVGVVTINPDMTDTPFFDALRFGVSEDENAKLLASDIADHIKNILNMREGSSITELTIRPQKFGISKKR